MDKTYSPKKIEAHWVSEWQQNGYANPPKSIKKESYSIVLPPPNVTGSLHMGHGFQQTLMDALIRYHRMCNHGTLWQGGTDHAGIATQMVVERQLQKKGKTRFDLGREAFVNEVWKWREESGDTIFGQMKRLGTSIDWENTRFTMDEVISKATREAFIRLHEEGLIYRGKKLVNWDPQLHTAISDLEVETQEVDGQLWHIRYPLLDEDGYLTVATTRPETLLGDTAVAVHPDDPRYQHLIGKQVQLPLCQRTIPVIADDSVVKDFGSGCVKITPAHDFKDYETGKRHNLPLITIFTPSAAINDNAPQAYQGLDRFAARKQIISDLEKHGLLEKVESHRLSLPRGERSGVVVEPYLTDQWFVKMKSLAKAALEVDAPEFVPSNWRKTYVQWLENIEDWCISRQLWWGHRIPVWYDDQGQHYIGHSEKDVRQRHHLKNSVPLKQEEDVLDTWFSSSLWPFATMGWPDKSKNLRHYFPGNVLVTGFDIIFFWVARMVMMSLKLTGEIPFKTVYITGLIRDAQGKKMSKSKGNVLDPIDIIDGISLDDLIAKRTQGLMQPKMKETIEKNTRKEFPEGINAHGTDALRFTFCALATHGRDINFDMGRIDGYRNFCNKLWNAARYVFMNTEESATDFDKPKPMILSIADRWIHSQLQNVIGKVHHYFATYRFDLLAQTLYEFVWNEYCDWYLELSKCHLNDGNVPISSLRGTRATLLHVLEDILYLLHPIMPFITEEIWQKLKTLTEKPHTSIMVAHFPVVNEKYRCKTVEKTIDWLKSVITAIRTLRSENNISPAKSITVLLVKGNEQDREHTINLVNYIKLLTKTENLTWVDEVNELSATALVDQLEIHVPLADVIDKERETARLQKAIEKLEKEIEKSNNKLDNPTYVSKAPEAVVNQERQRLLQFQLDLQKLSAQLNMIAS